MISTNICYLDILLSVVFFLIEYIAACEYTAECKYFTVCEYTNICKHFALGEYFVACKYFGESD